MKRILHIFLLSIYLPAALGVAFNVHYCEGAVESVKIFAYDSKGCCCGNEPSTGCCEDENELVKLEDNSQEVQPSSAFKTLKTISALPVYSIGTAEFIPKYFSSVQVFALTDNGPPLSDGIPFYLQHRSILI